MVDVIAVNLLSGSDIDDDESHAWRWCYRSSILVTESAHAGASRLLDNIKVIPPPRGLLDVGDWQKQASRRRLLRLGVDQGTGGHAWIWVVGSGRLVQRVLGVVPMLGSTRMAGLGRLQPLGQRVMLEMVRMRAVAGHWRRQAVVALVVRLLVMAVARVQLEVVRRRMQVWRRRSLALDRGLGDGAEGETRRRLVMVEVVEGGRVGRGAGADDGRDERRHRAVASVASERQLPGQLRGAVGRVHGCGNVHSGWVTGSSIKAAKSGQVR